MVLKVDKHSQTLDEKQLENKALELLNNATKNDAECTSNSPERSGTGEEMYITVKVKQVSARRCQFRSNYEKLKNAASVNEVSDDETAISEHLVDQ